MFNGDEVEKNRDFPSRFRNLEVKIGKSES